MSTGGYGLHVYACTPWTLRHTNRMQGLQHAWQHQQPSECAWHTLGCGQLLAERLHVSAPLRSFVFPGPLHLALHVLAGLGLLGQVLLGLLQLCSSGGPRSLLPLPAVSVTGDRKRV